MRPLSPPDFSGVLPEHLMNALHLCEAGKGDDVLARFESDFSALANTKHVVALSSATAALHLALVALGVGENDIVMCPSFTFAASAFPITYQKAIPYFVDSETVTWNMSPEYLEKGIIHCLSMEKKPKAVILVHAYGNVANLIEITQICQKYEINLIEDAANALGSTYKGKQVGSFGSIGVFSFNRNKIISAAAGGCLVTNQPDISEKVRYFAHQAKTAASYYQHEKVGYNYGLSPLLAELIRVQLPKLEYKVAERRNLYAEYQQSISPAIWQQEIQGARSNRWLNVVKLETKEQAKDLLETIQNEKVEIGRVWKPMHLQPIFETSNYIGNKESEIFFREAVCLPFSKQVASFLSQLTL
jgi:pyridoxal phosphate-dependent aminotransferase EpsN